MQADSTLAPTSVDKPCDNQISWDKLRDVNFAVLKWYEKKQRSGVVPSAVQLQKLATVIAKKSGISNFRGDFEWLGKFVAQYKVSFPANNKIRIQLDKADTERRTLWKHISKADYTHEDLYNATSAGEVTRDLQFLFNFFLNFLKVFCIKWHQRHISPTATISKKIQIKLPLCAV